MTLQSSLDRGALADLAKRRFGTVLAALVLPLAAMAQTETT